MSDQTNNTEQRKLDEMFKNVLSIKEFLAIIMKECIEEYKDEDLDTIINEYIENHIKVGETPVHPKISGGPTEINQDNKKTTFDINFYARLPKRKDRIGIVINVEAQGDPNPGYQIMNRAHYYNARNISIQFETFFDEHEYDNLRKVVSVWLMLDPPLYKSDGINRYVMYEEHIYGNINEDVTLIRKNEIIMVYLSKESKSKFIQLFNDLRDGTFEFDEFYETLKNDYGYEKKTDREMEVSQMCDYGQYVINKGIKQGIEQGIEQGKLEGIIEERLNQLQKRIKNRNLTLKEAMEDLEYDMNQYEFYKQKLEDLNK